MTPPSPTGSAAVRDPLHEDEASNPPPPAAVVPPPSNPVPVEPVVVSPVAPAVAATANPNPEPAGPPPNGIWQRLHLVIGGHYTFGGARVYGDAEPYASAAASHHGGGFFIQPSISAVRSRYFDLNVGLNIHQTFLSVPRSAGSVDSDISATTLGGLVEGNVFFHPQFGIGLNGTLGYMGLSSSNADVGGPYSASLSFDGNVALGAQVYLHGWQGAFRLGAGVNWMAGGFGISSPGNPDLLTSVSPQWSIFLGVDPLQIVRNAMGRDGERPQ